MDIVFRPETSSDHECRGLALLWRLAEGEPVTLLALAAAQGQPVATVQRALAGWPDVEYDEQGRIVGAGPILRPTRHRFEIEGRRLYTWCAMDTLVYPRLLGRPARITSACHALGTPIHLTIDDTGVTGLEPPTAVISLVTPEDLTSARSAFCSTCISSPAPRPPARRSTRTPTPPYSPWPRPTSPATASPGRPTRPPTPAAEAVRNRKPPSARVWVTGGL
ncbi:organomercurial lyase [Amycolatopsis aidingensis]|uniref:organomercurial lyase n=1 Tax=Amycolatopsis aidingensis TaxID=2842453 RepID=UPI001C0CA714|nr:organomercurial lyase [Amycolatopsis aidingensis]